MSMYMYVCVIFSGGISRSKLKEVLTEFVPTNTGPLLTPNSFNLLQFCQRDDYSQSLNFGLVRVRF